MPSLFPPAWVIDLRPVFANERGVWLVGGAVRDHLLNRRSQDLDFAVAGEARRLARRVADHLRAEYFDLDPVRDAGRVLHLAADGSRWVLDFARLRGDTLEHDLTSRDFTLNALAVDLRQPAAWIDPTGGAADLRAHRLRACRPDSIVSDPVRALRAVRLAVSLSLRIEPATIAQVRGAHGKIHLTSAERVRDEIVRTLDLPRPTAAVRLIDQLGLLPDVFPEVEALRGLRQPPQHAYDALVHSLAVVDHTADLLAVLAPQADEEASADLTLGLASVQLGRFRYPLQAVLSRELAGGRHLRPLVMLAALYHDVGKARTQSQDEAGGIRFLEHEALGAEMAAAWAERMRFSRLEIDRLRLVVGNHMRPGQLEKSWPISRRAIYRYFRQLGEAGVDVVLLSLADFLGKHTPPPPPVAWAGRLDTGRTLLEAFFELNSQVVEPPRLVDGEVLMRSLALPPGRQVGQLLEAVREAQVEEQVTTPGEALEFARQLLESGGPALAGG
ncbi:MAG: HD domain-containing protein [Anaerolineales bacterium]|nr:HD domain-containing protein [Anaerolineales bacterium]